MDTTPIVQVISDYPDHLQPMLKAIEEEMTNIRQFHIHHAKSLLPFPQEIQPREYVGFVHSGSLEGAFKASQNWDKPWNESQPCRSTSVGDIIQDGADFYMVDNFGFKKLEVGSDAPQYSQEDMKNEADLNAFESQSVEQ